MTLNDLIRTIDWVDVKGALSWLFPDDRKSLADFRRVFLQLLLKTPSSSRMRISIRTTFREGLDDTPFQEIIGRNSTLNRDLDDFEYLGQLPDSPFALEETVFSLALEPWDSWLGMHIDADTIRQFPPSHILAHCLSEMTFHGFTHQEIHEVREDLEKRVAELDTMSEEDKKQKLIPSEQVFERLRSKLREDL